MEINSGNIKNENRWKTISVYWCENDEDDDDAEAEAIRDLMSIHLKTTEQDTVDKPLSK